MRDSYLMLMLMLMVLMVRLILMLMFIQRCERCFHAGGFLSDGLIAGVYRMV